MNTWGPPEKKHPPFTRFPDRQAFTNAYFNRDFEALQHLITTMEKHAVLSIARVCHAVNRAYCASHGDHTHLPWEEAPAWQRDAALRGVEMHLANPEATPRDSHNAWMAHKQAEGWRYGPVKDPEYKLHPCMVPYEDLDERQRAKDWIFRAIVHAIAHELVRK